MTGRDGERRGVHGLRKRIVRVKVPATTANMGPGFDCMGAALSLYNHMEVSFSERPEVALLGEVMGGITTDETNLVYRSAQAVLGRFGGERPLKVRQRSDIPVARGLGSSAACIIGGMVAANVLLDNPMSLDELLSLACEMEGHPDNVTPALLGGLTLATSDGGKVLYQKLKVPRGLFFVVGIPEFELSTEEARRVVPDTVSRQDAVFNLSRAAVMAASLAKGDLSMLGDLCKDRLHQPYRSALVPGLTEILEGAQSQRALAAYLSGAGPSVACLLECGEGHDTPCSAAVHLGEYMVKTFSTHGIPAQYLVLSPEARGARVRVLLRQ